MLLCREWGRNPHWCHTHKKLWLFTTTRLDVSEQLVLVCGHCWDWVTTTTVTLKVTIWIPTLDKLDIFYLYFLLYFLYIFFLNLSLNINQAQPSSTAYWTQHCWGWGWVIVYFRPCPLDLRFTWISTFTVNTVTGQTWSTVNDGNVSLTSS